uniref:ATP synthase complex subunit 8 n=1 Tax=Epiphragma mediale TaxID=2804209 RepID=A0A7U0FL34_9DIPT|nr:ATP synthase F0 subunit 8 [Epiphragma mediale]QQV67799.1 ATP synthase F0 subunit 8 [Epiphragma mediale]
MPQMAPIKWLSLFIVFSITLIIFNLMNYFSFNLKFYNKKTSKNQISTKILNWKW